MSNLRANCGSGVEVVLNHLPVLESFQQTGRCAVMLSCIRDAVACRDKEVMGDPNDKGEQDEDARGKISMKELFGKKNITKDGKEGKVNVYGISCLPPQVEMARYEGVNLRS